MKKILVSLYTTNETLFNKTISADTLFRNTDHSQNVQVLYEQQLDNKHEKMSSYMHFPKEMASKIMHNKRGITREIEVADNDILFETRDVFSPLIVTPIDNGLKWVVHVDFYYNCKAGIGDNALTVCVPSGFVTDFASIPRVFWTILPPTGRYSRAAVIHDYLYVSQEKSKKYADVMFYKAMKDCGVKSYVRRVMFWAVRYFGQAAWNKNNKIKQ